MTTVTMSPDAVTDALRDAIVATTDPDRDNALQIVHDILDNVAGSPAWHRRETFYLELTTTGGMSDTDVQTLFSDPTIVSTITDAELFDRLLKYTVAQVAQLNTRVGNVETGLNDANTRIGDALTRVGTLETNLTALHADHEQTKRQLPKVTAAQAFISLAAGVLTLILLLVTGFANGSWSVDTPNFHMSSKTSSVLVDCLIGLAATGLFFGAWDAIRQFRNRS